MSFTCGDCADDATRVFDLKLNGTQLYVGGTFSSAGART